MAHPVGEPRDGPQALLDRVDNELRPRVRYLRRVDRVLAVSYGFTIAVNVMGTVIVDEWWRWLCLIIALAMALALRAHLRKMRNEAIRWREFDVAHEEFRRKVHEAHEHEI
jgi:hypothetical protein